MNTSIKMLINFHIKNIIWLTNSIYWEMITGIIFDAVRKNGGSYQMSINNLLTFVDNFKKK